jgi:hypothetical protein
MVEHSQLSMAKKQLRDAADYSIDKQGGRQVVLTQNFTVPTLSLLLSTQNNYRPR